MKANNDPAKQKVDMEKLMKGLDENFIERLMNLLHESNINIDRFIERVDALEMRLSQSQPTDNTPEEKSFLEGYRLGYAKAIKEIKHKKKKKKK